MFPSPGNPIPGQSKKPRMLYFSPDYTGYVVPNNMEPIIHRVDRWLSHFFDVVHISKDCSLATVVELYEPDILFFDGIIEGLHTLRLQIRDMQAYKEIPRAGLCRTDSLSPTRLVLFNYLEMMGVDAVFVLGDTSMGEAFEDCKNRIFYVPQYADPAVFHDYGTFKNIPVLMVGNWEAEQYPWRVKLRDQILKRFPSMYFRHPGYDPGGLERTPFMIHGEKYAKTINSSWIVPTSGGFKNIAISKHVEIPAARALLVTDRTPGVEEALGFKQMEHCVYVDDKQAVEALDYLLRHPDEMQRIIDNGYKFVHENHLLQHRDQLFQWWQLAKQKQPGQKIVQTDLLRTMELVPEESPKETKHVPSALDWQMLRDADSRLWKGDLAGADLIYQKVAKFCDYTSEPRLRMAIVRLLQGKPEEALPFISVNIERNSRYGGEIPDPLDIAYTLIGYLCAGDYNSALATAEQMKVIPRIEIDRARWAVYAALAQHERLFDLSSVEESHPWEVPSIQQLKRLPVEEHMLLIIKMLKACKQDKLAHNLEVLTRQHLTKKTDSIEKITTPSGQNTMGINAAVGASSPSMMMAGVEKTN